MRLGSMNNNIVMIHEVTDDVLNVNLSNFDILTFDDGLYTQYIHLNHFLQYNKPMYFFISTGIVCPDNVIQSTEPIHCEDAHEKSRNGNLENYMNWKQIQTIYNTPLC